MANATYLALIDFQCQSENTALFHGVLIDKARGERLEHCTFKVKQIPFVVHYGPFDTLDDATVFIKSVNKFVEDELEDEAGVFHFTSRIETEEPGGNWKAIPSAYLDRTPGQYKSSRECKTWWLTFQIIYEAAGAFAYSTYHRHLKEFCLNERSKWETTGRFSRTNLRCMWWQTDRSLQDSVVRLLAPYTVPGFFDCSLPRSTTNNETRYTVTWANFDTKILSSQRKDEREALDLFEPDLNSGTARYNYFLNLRIALATNTSSAKDTVVEFFDMDMSTGNSTTFATSKHTKNKCSLKILLQNGLRPDILLLGFTPDQLDKIQAKLIEEHEENPKNNKKFRSPFNLTNVHSLIKEKSEYAILPSNLPYAITNYDTVPFFVVKLPNPDMSKAGRGACWDKQVEIHTYLSQLFLRARITGRNLSFLSAPFGRSSVSARAESLITRVIRRKGYHVLPLSPKVADREHEPQQLDNLRYMARHLNDEEDDPVDEEEDVPNSHLPRVAVEGGINGEVTAQYVCQPSAVVDVDMQSFYGALICHFKIDLCSDVLWTEFAHSRQDLVRQQRQTDAPVTHEQRIDHFGELWHKKFDKEAIAVNDNPREGQETEATPIVEYIKMCLLLRRSMQAEKDPLIKARNQPLVDFLKSTVSAIYGAIAYDFNRYCHKAFAALVTYLGRKLIQEASAKLLYFCPNKVGVKQIMCVTDSMALRFPANLAERIKRDVARLEKEHIHARYSDIFQLTVVPVSHLLMAKRNNYARIEEASGKLVVKGFAPRRNDIPQIIKDALSTILKHFMTEYKKNVWAEPGADFCYLPADRPHFIKTLTSGVAAAVRARLLSDDVPEGTSGNKRYFVNVALEDAKRRCFIYHPHDLDTVEVKTQLTLGFVTGCVVEHDPLRGFIVSMRRPITDHAWRSYYLDYLVRKELVVMLGTLFPAEAIDESVCNILSDLPRVDSWAGKAGGAGTKTDSKPVRLASGYWEKVMACAYGENDKDQTAKPILVEQEVRTIERKHDLTDAEMMRITLPGEEPVALPSHKKKKLKKPKKTRTTWNPLRFASAEPEFEWCFGFRCKSCDGSLRSQAMKTAETYICPRCGNSIFGDFMQAEDSSADNGETTLQPITLHCTLKTDKGIVEFDYLDPDCPRSLQSHNWISLESFEGRLLAICNQETDNAPNKSSPPPPGSTEEEQEEAELRKLEGVALLSNVTGLDSRNIERLATTNQKCLAVVFQCLNFTHPYVKCV